MSSAAPQIPKSRGAAAPWTQAATVLLVIAVIVGYVGAVRRAVHARPDWDDLQTETRYVWEHRQTAPGTAMFGYLPTATFALLPFMVWLPTWVGAPLFALSNVVAAGISLALIVRFWVPPARREAAYVVVALLMAANFAHAIQANQMTLWTLCLCVAGLTAAGRGREWLSGLLLGLAICIKTIPVLLVGLLLLRGHWRALAGVAIAVAVFDVVPSVLFFGPTKAVAEHRAWFRRAGWHSNQRMIAEPMLRVHRHGNNAAYSSVLTRWLCEMPPSTVTDQVILYGQPTSDVISQTRGSLKPSELLTLDPMPPREGSWREKRVSIAWVPRWSVARLSAAAVQTIWAGTLAGAFLLLAWGTWSTRSTGGVGDGQQVFPVVAALWLLAMFWPSPMMRHYYLAWALPAIAIIGAVVGPSGTGRVSSRGASAWPVAVHAWAWLAVVGWAVGVACLGWRVARWYGVHLLALALLAIALAWIVAVLNARHLKKNVADPTVAASHE